MAAGYGCANEECQRPVNWLITHLNPPLTLSTCDEDSPVFLIPILAAELGVDADKLYDAIRRHVDREAKAAAKATSAAEALEGQGADGQGDEAVAPPGTPAMSRAAAAATESGGLVVDRGEV